MTDKPPKPAKTVTAVQDAVANHASGRFAPHGSMSVRQDGAIVTGRATGPFNLEFMQAYGRMWGKHFGQWGGPQARVLITEWQGSMLTSMEVIEAFAALMLLAKKALDPRMLHIWHVPLELEGRAFMLPKWAAAMSRSGLMFIVCDNKESVERTVQQHLSQSSND